ncbi:MAG: hypothetical protein CBE24_04940 [bacterium TMED264]|nr:MAG: hypothetical protein CBE24_04940 [bacterium TMED264]
MKYIFFYISIFTFLFSAKIQEDDIELFLLSRYGGDSANVSLFISDEFTYKHTPYVGLGVETRYIDESLLITKVLNDSIQKYLQVGDRVYEHNNEIVDSLGLITNGPVGEKQKLIVIKNGEIDFRVMEIPLEEYHYEENKSSFLESVIKYSEKWYDYDLEIIDILKKKNSIAVHYRWEGSRQEKGKIYTFSAIEFYYINKKKDLIDKIEGLWSEKQFRDQFK